jgi:putative tryptophan/tyrosine transport system substrate-binding protein
MFDAFREGLHDLGYVEGRNIILEFRLARGNSSLFRRLAAELVALPVDVVVLEGTGSFPAVNAVDPSGHIPIVSPVLMILRPPFVASLARPGGNLTGFTLMHTELNAKRLDLLRTAFPHIAAVTALVNPSSPVTELAFEETATAARSLGLGSIDRVEAESIAAFRALRPEVFSGASAVVVVPDGMFYDYREDVVGLVNAARLPAIYPEREYADSGGLISYGANVPDNFRRAAVAWRKATASPRDHRGWTLWGGADLRRRGNHAGDFGAFGGIRPLIEARQAHLDVVCRAHAAVISCCVLPVARARTWSLRLGELRAVMQPVEIEPGLPLNRGRCGEIEDRPRAFLDRAQWPHPLPAAPCSCPCKLRGEGR